MAEFVIAESLAAALCWFIRAAGFLTSRLKWVYTGKTQSYLSGFEISKSPKTLHTGRWEICRWVTHLLPLGKFTFLFLHLFVDYWHCNFSRFQVGLSPLSVDYAVVHTTYCVKWAVSQFRGCTLRRLIRRHNTAVLFLRLLQIFLRNTPFFALAT